MKPSDTDRELDRLQQASERVGANLVELEIDSSRRLLETTPLTGKSAERWAAASAALTDLWQWHGLLKELIGRAEKLTGSRRADQLRALLQADSIELTTSDVPLAERDLLGTAQVTVRCSPDQLLERMSRAFDEVKTVVARFGEAWEMLSPRLAGASRAVEEAQELAVTLGERDRADLTEAARSAEVLRASLRADPLSVAPDEVDRVTRSLESIRRDLEATAALRREFDARVADARALLASLESAAGEGQAAHEEALMKISVPAGTSPFAPPRRLAAELDQIAALARAGAWRDARHRLDAWTSGTQALLEEARRTLRANRAPIEARNQFRALLEAYQVKAQRLGVVEDPELEQTFARAHEALYTAPTDLALVAQLVRRYQELISSAGAVQGTPR